MEGPLHEWGNGLMHRCTLPRLLRFFLLFMGDVTKPVVYFPACVSSMPLQLTEALLRVGVWRT